MIPPYCIRNLIEEYGCYSERVAQHEALRVLEWAEALPGWAGGPEFAPNPLVFEEVE